MSTSKNSNSNTNKSADTAKQQATSGDSATSTSEATTTSSTAATRMRTAAATTLAQGRQQLSKRVRTLLPTRTNIEDLLTITSIVVVFGFMAVAPFASREMKKSNRTMDDMFISEDPVDDFPQLAREEWLELGKSNPNVLEDVLSDVVRSRALQQAAQQFVVQILESDEVRTALNRLVKQLWTDLVTDPETLAQVIHLLQHAIQNPQVKRAAQTLVIELVNEPDVKQALIDMVQRLGQSTEVQKATQGLLVQSAHRSLNDAEILEHSMEFATDVLGDDVVQETAGQALRNTVGHAFRPAATIAVTAAGISFIIFGIVAIGYARSSDQEVHLLETAAKSLQTNAAFGLGRLLSWPFRKLHALTMAVVEVVVYRPVQTVVNVVHAVVQLPGRLYRAAVSGATQGASRLYQRMVQGMHSMAHALVNRVSQGRQAVVASMVGAARAVVQHLQSQWKRTQSSTNRALQRQGQAFLDWLVVVEESITKWWQQQYNQARGSFS